MRALRRVELERHVIRVEPGRPKRNQGAKRIIGYQPMQDVGTAFLEMGG